MSFFRSQFFYKILFMAFQFSGNQVLASGFVFCLFVTGPTGPHTPFIGMAGTARPFDPLC